MARPQSQHRLSVSSTTSQNFPIRHIASRHHSHSISVGSIGQSHRITRRKSMTSTAVNNIAAITAVINRVDEGSIGASLQSNRHSLTLMKAGTSRDLETALSKEAGSLVETPNSGNDMTYGDKPMRGCEQFEEDIAIDENASSATNGASKARARRASEGAHLSKNDGKRSSGELRCEQCGKGYKHSSCLTKHLWEHTPEWTYTSKLLISKHQQVQLLEAASVLVGMNQDASAIPEISKNSDSDHSSASPAASRSSEPHDDDISSAETTPPPMNEHACHFDSYHMGRSKRYSSTSSAFSRSYQSAPSSSLPSNLLSPTATSFVTSYQTGQQRRPSTAAVMSPNSLLADEDEASLAAAIQSLCSFGTPRSGPVHPPPDIPPVPPLPARFAGQNSNKKLPSNPTTLVLQPDFGMPPPPLTHRISDERHVRMNQHQVSNRYDDEDHDDRSTYHGRSDDDDDGVFGRMEE